MASLIIITNYLNKKSISIIIYNKCTNIRDRVQPVQRFNDNNHNMKAYKILCTAKLSIRLSVYKTL
jgi:hypothetical protein